MSKEAWALISKGRGASFELKSADNVEEDSVRRSEAVSPPHSPVTVVAVPTAAPCCSRRLTLSPCRSAGGVRGHFPRDDGAAGVQVAALRGGPTPGVPGAPTHAEREPLAAVSGALRKRVVGIFSPRSSVSSLHPVLIVSPLRSLSPTPFSARDSLGEVHLPGRIDACHGNISYEEVILIELISDHAQWI